MNKLVNFCFLGGWVSALLLGGCGDKEKLTPATVGTWEETEMVTTWFDAQNQVQSVQTNSSWAGQLLTLQADGAFEHAKFTGTVNGTYIQSGETLVFTRASPFGGSVGTYSLKVLEATATNLRLLDENAGSSSRVFNEVRYRRK